jgi:hypothetical protein
MLVSAHPHVHVEVLKWVALLVAASALALVAARTASGILF